VEEANDVEARLERIEWKLPARGDEEMLELLDSYVT